jgi:hypothetical protein
MPLGFTNKNLATKKLFTHLSELPLYMKPFKMGLVRLAYQPPANSTFLSEQISHQQPASSTFLSEQTSTSHQPPAKRTGCKKRLFKPIHVDRRHFNPQV